MKAWKITGLILLVLAIIFGGYVAFTKITKATKTSTNNKDQIIEVQRGKLEITISADGNVEAPHQAKLSFDSSGTIKELKVKVGDRVKKGDILARMDTSDLERTIVDAEAGVKNAEKAIKDTQELYDLSAVAQAEATLAAAQATVKEAEKALKDVQPPYNLSPYTSSDIYQAEAAVASAQAQVKDAENALSKAQLPTASEDIAHYQAAVDNAQKALDIARQDLLTAKLNRDRNVADTRESLRQEQEKYRATIRIQLVGEAIYTTPQTLLGVDTIANYLTIAYQSLLKARDDARIAQETGDKHVASSEAAVSKAQDIVKKTQEELDRKINDFSVERTVRQHQLDNAKASLSQAQEELRKRKAGPDPLLIASRELSLENAKANLVKAQEDLKKRKAGPDPLEAASRQLYVENAKANLVKAQEDLKKKKAGPNQVEMASKQAQMAAAQAALNSAREKLEKATIIAPFDALVSSVNNRKVWDRVGPYDIIVHLIDPTEFEIEALVDEIDIYQVKAGQKVYISLDASPKTQLVGKVNSISPAAQRQTGIINYQVTIGISAYKDIILKEGLTASSNIVIEDRQSVLMVPGEAVYRKGENSFVQVIVNGQPQERKVHTGITQNGQIEILDGLSEGESIIGGKP